MIHTAIKELTAYGIKNDLIMPVDEIYVRNNLMDMLGVTDWNEPETVPERELEEILDELISYACEKGIIEDTISVRDRFDTKLMGVLTAMPHEINAKFNEKYAKSPQEATDWYYKFSKDTNYVRAARMKRDIRWKYESEYGVLDITINRSKPEKDPRDIAAAKAAPQTAYPACQLCMENVGFPGHANHPARQNIRPVDIDIYGGKWALQYSPYGYYNEHCIVLNQVHCPMKIDAAVFEKLFDFVELFPHYFLGSNADLPIVGGSILSHEHFQGGHYTFAMETAPIERTFELSKFPTVKAGTVKWPMSVIRLTGDDRKEIAAAATMILNEWRKYSDPAAEIYAETEGTPHNTITPIARMKNGKIECDLVLRNNRTTEDRPLGLFHPRPELHHIKKENIGLIEVTGLAVLPARLAVELKDLEKAMLEGKNIAEIESIASHAVWAKNVLARHPEFNKDNAEAIIREEVGAVFAQVLEDAGVYKRDGNGQAAFMRFIDVIK